MERKAENMECAIRAKMSSEHALVDAKRIVDDKKTGEVSFYLKERIARTWMSIITTSNLIDVERRFGNTNEFLEEATKNVREAEDVMQSIDAHIPYRFVYSDEKRQAVVEKYGERVAALYSSIDTMHFAKEKAKFAHAIACAHAAIPPGTLLMIVAKQAAEPISNIEFRIRVFELILKMQRAGFNLLAVEYVSSWAKTVMDLFEQSPGMPQVVFARRELFSQMVSNFLDEDSQEFEESMMGVATKLLEFKKATDAGVVAV